jgi:hypothetical protein
MSVKDMSRFTPEQIEAVQKWVDFCFYRIEDAGWEGRIRTGLNHLTDEAQKIWPAMMAGEPVDLTVRDLGSSWEDVDEDESWVFVACAGYVLLNGQDSPNVTAVHMRTALDTMTQTIKGDV